MNKINQRTLESYRLLFSFNQLTQQQKVIKSLLLIVVAPLFTLCLLFALTLFLIERLLVPFFRLFIWSQITIIQKRFRVSIWLKRLYGLLGVIATLLLVPFVMGYYLAMLLKTLMKYFMKRCIAGLDFSKNTPIDGLRLLDDADEPPTSNVDFLLKDIKHSSSLGSMLAAYFDQNNQDLASLLEDDDDNRVPEIKKKKGNTDD